MLPPPLLRHHAVLLLPCCCRDRLLYTLVCLAIFLVCSQLPLYGVKTTSGAGACIGDLCK